MEPEPRSHCASEVVPNEYVCRTRKPGGKYWTIYYLIVEQLAINVMCGGDSGDVCFTPYTKMKFRWTKTKRVKKLVEVLNEWEFEFC